jgi:hypothetical protein
MPKYCPDCGTKLDFVNAKFCPQCGISFVVQPSTSDQKDSEVIVKNKTEAPLAQIEPSRTTPQKIDIHNLAKKMEATIEDIYKESGYDTDRNKKFRHTGKIPYEIDVIAQKSNDNIAIECKNYDSVVGIEKLNHFAEKLRWLNEDTGLKWRGLFVAYSGISSGAEEIAKNNYIDTWDNSQIAEKLMQYHFGRLNVKGEKVTFKDTLLINHNYLEVTSLKFANKEKVTIADDVQLIVHPYIKLHCHYDEKYTDPSQKKYHFQENDIVIVDLLDGKVLNPLIRDTTDGITKALKFVVSSKEREENKRTKELIKEITNSHPSPEFSLVIGEDYKINPIDPNITIKSAWNSALDYLKAKYSCTITYSIQNRDGSLNHFGTKQFVPNPSRIRLTGKEIINVPKWTIHFNSFGTIFVREVLAHSGAILEDTTEYCPQHLSFGVISHVIKTKQKTIAVCEECGKAFCEIHIDRCPICNKWLCKEDSVECSSCRKRHCKEHSLQNCSSCHLPLCSNCITNCSICNADIGKNHLLKCEKCGITGCEKCIQKKASKGLAGLVKSERICKNCFDTRKK